MRLPVLRSQPTLQPQKSFANAAQDAVNELLREGESQNTLASYRSALRYWAGWFVLRYGAPLSLPTPPAAVMQFIVDHAERSTEAGLRNELPAAIDQALVDNGFKGNSGALALNTIVHRIAVLSKAHQMRQVKNPCEEPKVRELLSKTRRAYAKRGERPNKKDALTGDPLRALLATCTSRYAASVIAPCSCLPGEAAAGGAPRLPAPIWPCSSPCPTAITATTGLSQDQPVGRRPAGEPQADRRSGR